MFTTLEYNAQYIARAIIARNIKPFVLKHMVSGIAPEKIALTAVIAELVKKNDVSEAVERLQAAFPEYNIPEMFSIEQEVEGAQFIVDQDYQVVGEDSGFVLV